MPENIVHFVVSDAQHPTTTTKVIDNAVARRMPAIFLTRPDAEGTVSLIGSRRALVEALFIWTDDASSPAPTESPYQGRDNPYDHEKDENIDWKATVHAQSILQSREYTGEMIDLGERGEAPLHRR